MTTVFYIHGANCTPDSFSYLISGMPDGFSFDYDLYDARKSSIPQIIDDVKFAIMGHDDPVHIVGHSLGGIIAMNLAHEIPNMVRSVTTIATPFHGIEVPLFLRLLHWHDQFLQNIIPTNPYYARAQAPIDMPFHLIRTHGGSNPLFGFDNDGVVSMASQAHGFADKVSETPFNHFEVLMHPSIRQAIVEFIETVD